MRKCPQKVAFFQNQPNHLIRISEPIFLSFLKAAIQIFFSRPKLVKLQLDIIESIFGVKIHMLRDVHPQKDIRSVRCCNQEGPKRGSRFAQPIIFV